MATRPKASALDTPLSADELAIRQRHLDEKDRRLRDERRARKLRRENATISNRELEKMRHAFEELQQSFTNLVTNPVRIHVQ